MKSIRLLFKFVALSVFIAGCAVNPVTGKREFSLVSEGQEIALGEENYAYMQQSGGGEYDIDPVLTEYVQGIGNRLAEVSDRPLPYEFVVLNSSVPNAWALPGGKIAINRGLLTEMSSEAELAAVIGHEIVHAAARHSARQMSRGMLLQVAVVGTAIATSNTGYSDLAMGGASVGAQLINQSYGRSAELESDFYGMQYMSRAGYDPQGAVELQRTFVRLSEGRESDWLSGLFASHPPSQERVDANIQTATTLPSGGEIGAEKFRAAMQKTLDLKPAYDLLDEGRESLGKKLNQQAIQKAEQAIALFPDEANFYALRGDARYLSEEYEMAVSNYDIAIRRRENFFQYHLQRGLAHEKLGNDDAAFTDLERSNELFPTAIATFSLGNLEANRGNKEKAIEYYTAVANSSGETAEAAKVALVRLDLEDNPDKYLQVRCFADTNANLVVSVGNGTPVAVGDIEFLVRFTDANSISRRYDGVIRGPVGPGQRGDHRTNLRPFTADGNCPVSLTSARIAE